MSLVISVMSKLLNDAAVSLGYVGPGVRQISAPHIHTNIRIPQHVVNLLYLLISIV